MTSLRNLIDFFKDSYNELTHVSWLTKKEMIASTYVVIIVVLLTSCFIASVDFVLLWVFARAL